MKVEEEARNIQLLNKHFTEQCEGHNNKSRRQNLVSSPPLTFNLFNLTIMILKGCGKRKKRVNESLSEENCLHFQCDMSRERGKEKEEEGMQAAMLNEIVYLNIVVVGIVIVVK